MKTKILIILFSLVLFIGCSEKLPNEVYFFENYEVENGKYKLFVIGTEGEWIDDYKDFYIDDIETLKKMKTQWIFSEKSEVMPCGYGYIIYLVNKKEVLKSEAINIECEYMSGWIKFPKKYITEYKDKFVRMSESEKLNFENKYLNNQNVK
ncbi:hypothetical protein SAMN05421741_10817 [Paenimyroides ummariense]|uniref:Lipoprotein n=1 Tax=Paenimyroides ummariense TaxID=913024 RepID=A0A1I5AER7_9FLAO|nr:hypothetical protein [Paenimyroides ummariense]SFN60918.1 hypothetical protein SAMN05421741_10817 [Paenimyroides ummariense]